MSKSSLAPNGKATEPIADWEDDDSSEGSEEAGNEANAKIEDDADDKPPTEDSEASDEEDDDDTESKVLQSYRRILSRRVDLVGDYAGNELFLIEGDSLLLRCFSDDKLDFAVGLQLLHAAYNVERFLHQLIKRKCNFQIVFFSSNRDLCVPPQADQANHCKYFLARAAIIRHLQINLKKTQPDIAVLPHDPRWSCAR